MVAAPARRLSERQSAVVGSTLWPMRGQLRMIAFGVVIVVIVVAFIVESPGTVEILGLVVLITMILLIVRERRQTR
jgi:Flp pilus assembly protein TadB